MVIARKPYGEDDILRLIREVEVHCSSGVDVVSACRAAGVSDKTSVWLAQEVWRNEELGKRKPAAEEDCCLP